MTMNGAAPARRARARLRLAARSRAVHREAHGLAGRRQRVQPGAHPGRDPEHRPTRSRSPSARLARAGRLRARDQERGLRASSRSPIPIRARRSKAAHSAGARPASCRRSSPRTFPTMKAGDVTEPIRTPSGLHIFKVLEVRGGAGAGDGLAGARAAHPDEAERSRGRRDDPAEARADPRARAEGRKLRGDRVRHLGRPGLGGRRAATSAGPDSRQLRAGVRARQVDALADNEISQPFKYRSTAGTSSSCSAAARTTQRRHDAQSLRRRSCARRAPTKRRRSGCVACATKPSSNTACEHAARAAPAARRCARSRITSGEPAGIGPDICSHAARRRRRAIVASC